MCYISLLSHKVINPYTINISVKKRRNQKVAYKNIFEKLINK